MIQYDYLAVAVAGCLLSAPLAQCKRGFLHADEDLFNQHFQSGALTEDSYAEVAISAPSRMKSSCVNQGNIGDWSKLPEVTVSSETASNLQQTCGTKSICVVPVGVTVELRQNLDVAALRVEGSLFWTDDTQASDEQWLCAGYATVERGGTFLISITNPKKRAWVYMKANGGVHPVLGERVFGGIGNGRGSANKRTSLTIAGRPLERTWSLLAEPGKQADKTIKLMHSAEAMGWRVGDRIVVAPTAARSTGVAGQHRISKIKGNNEIEVTPALGQNYRADFVWQGPGSGAGLLSAEVINLQRNVIVTGDDFSSVTSTDPDVETSVAVSHIKCKRRRTAGNSISKTCTLGLHTVMFGPGGNLVMKHTRVEKCGQRGLFGHYCVHMHYMGECPNCLVKGNAIEFGMQRGIIVHQTHLSTVEDNVLNDIRGAHIYIEDGNEMYNKIQYNVAICPWPMVNDDGKMAVSWKGGCTVPGTDNFDADTASNQAGLWAVSSINHVVGNRFANSFNGMLYQGLFGGAGRTGSPIGGRVCTTHSQIGRLEGNTFHGHGRFGTYFLNWIYPRHTDQSLLQNGEVKNMDTCSPYKADGTDNGFSLAIANQVDYGNAFVGFYDGGDIQYRNHLSLENTNLIYWKSSKNFADGCGAHISYGQMAKGNLALPDHQTFIIEHTVLQQKVDVEANHHCGVGPTGALCFPTYVLVNTTWGAGGAVSWNKDGGMTNHNNNGGVFTLPPNEETRPLGNFFPHGFVSLVSDYHKWLLHVTDSQGGKVCVEAKTLGNGMGAKYGHGILCKKPLRAMRVWAKDTVGSQLHVRFYQGDRLVSTSKYDMWTRTRPKQGYAFPVLANDNTYRYELSLDGSKPLPTSWAVEFSDPVIGNRWTHDAINLRIRGRTCAGNKVTSQHDRRYLHAPMTIDVTRWSVNRGMYPQMWGENGQKGHGACNGYEDENPVDCSKVPELKQGGQCDGQCGRECKNGWCDCGTKQCICNPGFTGSSCDVDLGARTRCGKHGHYSGQYLGGTAPPTARACVCEPGFSGPLCDRNPCIVDGNPRSCGHGSCVAVARTELSATTWRCECEEGYSGDKCDKDCSKVCKGTWPFGCNPNGKGPGKPAWCLSNGGCAYDPPSQGSAFCCFANCPAASGTCDCPPARNDCHAPPVCQGDNTCSASVAVADGRPCNSVVGGVCAGGTCSKSTADPVVTPATTTTSVTPTTTTTSVTPTATTTSVTPTTTTTDSPTPTPASDGQSTCAGPYSSAFPECEARIQWLLGNWKQAHYTAKGVDGSRCSIQNYLSTHEKYCPAIAATTTTTSVTPTTTTTTSVTPTTTTTSVTPTTTTTSVTPTTTTTDRPKPTLTPTPNDEKEGEVAVDLTCERTVEEGIAITVIMLVLTKF